MALDIIDERQDPADRRVQRLRVPGGASSDIAGGLPSHAGGKALDEKQVEIRADEESRDIVPECVPATEEDWGKEYLDYILSLKTVWISVDEAIAPYQHATIRGIPTRL